MSNILDFSPQQAPIQVLPRARTGPPEGKGESSRFFRVGPREGIFRGRPEAFKTCLQAIRNPEDKIVILQKRFGAWTIEPGTELMLMSSFDL